MKTSRSDLVTGDIVLLSLDPTRGSETKKTRPCLVIQSAHGALPLVIVLPVTDNSKKRGLQLFVPIPEALLKRAGLRKPSSVDCYQIRAVSVDRIVRVMGKVDAALLFDVRHKLALVLEIDEEHV